MISTPTDETKVQKLFQNKDQHRLNEKRICFSYELLENIQKNSRCLFRPVQKKIVWKEIKSLDFYDVLQSICRFYLKFDSERISIVDPEKIDVDEKIEFNVESAENSTFQKMDDENINEKIKSLENRLNNLESRLVSLKKINLS